MCLWILLFLGDCLWWGLIKESDIDFEIIFEFGVAAIFYEGIVLCVL